MRNSWTLSPAELSSYEVGYEVSYEVILSTVFPNINKVNWILVKFLLAKPTSYVGLSSIRKDLF